MKCIIHKISKYTSHKSKNRDNICDWVSIFNRILILKTFQLLVCEEEKINRVNYCFYNVITVATIFYNYSFRIISLLFLLKKEKFVIEM